MIQKFVIFCAISLFCIGAHATIMCATDDTLAIVLDPYINATSFSKDNALFEWSASFPYGTVFGVAACVTTPSGTVRDTRDTLIDADTGNVVTGGEFTGQYCWCQMTHPVKSHWVFNYDQGSIAKCLSVCTEWCGIYVRDWQEFRLPMFGSIGK